MLKMFIQLLPYAPEAYKAEILIAGLC